MTQLADGTLDKYLRGLGRCPLDVFIGIMEDVLGGLVFLHTLKPNAVIHRDLKVVVSFGSALPPRWSYREYDFPLQPDNIFYFLKRGALTVKIGDVGLSRFTNAAGRLGAGYGGAVFYLAPEVRGPCSWMCYTRIWTCFVSACRS